MAAPYSFEPTIRIQDKAVYDWLGGFLVDYVIEDPETKRILVNQPQVPVIRTVSSPDRAFATVVDQLVSKGWIDGSSDATKRAKAEYDWAVLPLPVVTIDRDEPTPSNLLQMPPTSFRTMFLDSQGRYIPVAAPLHYITVYRLTFWSNKRYTHSHFMEWILGQQGLPGAGPQEVYIPVQHEAPWGTILHALRYTESANLSSLEGDDPRYIRTQLAFTLRSWLFRALPDETRSVDSIYTIGADVASNIDGANPQESVPFQPSATLNLYTNPYPAYLLPTAWPKYGAATVEAAGSAPQSTIVATLTTGATDRVPLVQKLSTLGTDGRAYLSLGMTFRSIGSFAIELRQSAIDGTGETVVRRRVIPADPDDQWRNIHMFSSVTGAKFEWSIVSSGSATVVTTSTIDARQLRDVTTLTPTTYSTVGSDVIYSWNTLSNQPYILYATPYSGSGTITAGSSAGFSLTRTTSADHTTDASIGLLVMPIGTVAALKVPTALGVSAVFAVPFDGAYLGDIDTGVASVTPPAGTALTWKVALSVFNTDRTMAVSLGTSIGGASSPRVSWHQFNDPSGTDCGTFGNYVTAHHESGSVFMYLDIWQALRDGVWSGSITIPVSLVAKGATSTFEVGNWDVVNGTYVDGTPHLSVSLPNSTYSYVSPCATPIDIVKNVTFGEDGSITVA